MSQTYVIVVYGVVLPLTIVSLILGACIYYKIVKDRRKKMKVNPYE
jgi:hypothetical protein